MAVRKEEETSIPLKKSTRARLKELGKKDESWDGLLNRMMDEIESYGEYEKLKKDLGEKEAWYKQEIALLKDEINTMVDNCEEAE